MPTIATTSTVAALHVGRRHQPADPLEHDHRGQREQGRAVQLGGEDLGAPHPEGEAAPGRTPRQPRGEDRERDRARIGEHVGGVREQRQGGGQDPGHDLHRHERQDQRQGDPQTTVRRRPGAHV